MTTTNYQTVIAHLGHQDPVLKQLIGAAAPLAFDSSGDVYYDLLPLVFLAKIEKGPVNLGAAH